jgi:hypothetical protein
MIRLLSISRVYVAVLVILPSSAAIAQSGPGLSSDHRLIMEVIINGQPNRGSFYPRPENDLRGQVDSLSAD